MVQEAGWAPGPVWTSVENLDPHRNSIPGPSNPESVIPTELPCPQKLVACVPNISASMHIASVRQRTYLPSMKEIYIFDTACSGTNPSAFVVDEIH